MTIVFLLFILFGTSPLSTEIASLASQGSSPSAQPVCNASNIHFPSFPKHPQSIRLAMDLQEEGDRDALIDRWLDALMTEVASPELAIESLRLAIVLASQEGVVPLSVVGTAGTPLGPVIEYTDKGKVKIVILWETPDGYLVSRYSEDDEYGEVLHGRITIIPELIVDICERQIPVESADFRFVMLQHLSEPLPLVNQLTELTEARLKAISDLLFEEGEEKVPDQIKIKYLRLLTQTFSLWEAEERQKLREKLRAAAERVLDEELVSQFLQDVVFDENAPHMLEEKFATHEHIGEIFTHCGLDINHPLHRLWVAREYCRQKMLREELEFIVGTTVDILPEGITLERFPRYGEVFYHHIIDSPSVERRFYQVIHNGKTVGLMEFKVTEKGAVVDRVEVAREYRGVGIGRIFMGLATKLSIAHGFKGEFFVSPTEVIVDGGEARGFYTHIGLQQDMQFADRVICPPELAQSLTAHLGSLVDSGKVRYDGALSVSLASFKALRLLSAAL